MARYIDADKFIAHLKDEIKGCEKPFGSRANGKSIAYGTALGLKSAISFAETLDTADVAPKSEVAREIFEEIITTIFSKMPSDILLVGKDCDFADGIRMGKREAIFDMINTLSELKKKYTEGSSNDR